MVSNRFQGILQGSMKTEANLYGIYAGEMDSLEVVGALSESGLGTDTGGNEDYSSTATFFSYKATTNCVIESLVLLIHDGTVDETAALDTTLFAAGSAALTNGIQWGVDTNADFSAPLISSLAAKSLVAFSTTWGARLVRDLSVHHTTNSSNHDACVVQLVFRDICGFPIRLRKDDYIGVYLNDDLSGLDSLTGKVFGRKIFN